MKPVCSTCNDTHRMMLGEDREVMCTFCPVPCQECRAGGNGPYCTATPCPCKCHRKDGSRRSEIDLNDARRRCRDMVNKHEGGHGRSLSENDRASIGLVLAELARLESLLSMSDAARRLPPYQSGRIYSPDAAPSAPLNPQSRAEEAVEREREEIVKLCEAFLHSEGPEDSRDDLDRLARYSNGTVRRIVERIRERNTEASK